jgi:hypothetical protein
MHSAVAYDTEGNEVLLRVVTTSAAELDVMNFKV